MIIEYIPIKYGKLVIKSIDKDNHEPLAKDEKIYRFYVRVL